MARVRSKLVDTDPRSTPPKLSLYSLPSQRREPSGMATPPIRVPVSVPFSWEEAPGKPRKEPGGCDSRRSPSPLWYRGLDLPPRMVVEEMRSNNGSSMVGLDGPYVLGRAATCTSFSFGENPVKSKERGVWFWRRRGKGRKVRRDRNWEMSFRGLKGFISPPSLSSSSQSSADSSGGDGVCNEEEEEEAEAKHERKVRITRFRRTKSLASVSSYYATSQLWAGIYGTLKQFVPWRKERAI